MMLCGPAASRRDRSPGSLPRSRIVLAFLIAAFQAAVNPACSTSAPSEGPPGEVRRLTGTPTRLVWMQGDGSDPLALGDDLTLMGFDSEDGRGERVMLPDPASYVKPLLTPSGTRIVYSRRSGPEGAGVFILDWNGSRPRKIADGFGLAVWRDPADGGDWVYVGTNLREDAAARVIRFPIDRPLERETVWSRTPVTIDTFQVSDDGRYAAGLFPWPDAGVATLPDGSLSKLGEGCWTALGAARGPLAWYFDGAHRNLTMVEVQTERRWSVAINQVPEFAGAEVYHPRWANHPRFLVMTGPYDQGGDNQVRSGGAQTEIYLGRFSADFTRVEAWARVTRNARGDAYPDVWVARDGSPYPLRPPGPVGPAVSPSARVGDQPEASERATRVVVEVRLARAGPVPSPATIAPYHQALVVNEYEVVKVLDGSLHESRIAVAQWAIRDRRVLADAVKVPGTRHTLTIERYDAHPELEGERLVAHRETATATLFYDLGVR